MGDLQWSSTNLPAWVQAGAAVLSFGVTFWLAKLTSRYVRTTKDIADSSKEQVQQAIELVRTNDVGTARALMEEVARIRSELGDPPDEAIPPVLTASIVVPTVHPWMQPIIPTIARSDAEI